MRKENRQRGKGKRGMPAESESSVKLSPKLFPVTATYIPLARLTPNSGSLSGVCRQGRGKSGRWVGGQQHLRL